MTPLVLFLLACATVYVGTVDAAFTALMRLSLRLDAERHEWLDRWGYFDDPVRLFVPLRVLSGLLTVFVATVVWRIFDPPGPAQVAGVGVGLVLYQLVCGYVVPFAIARQDPVRALEMLLPSFRSVVRATAPLTRPLVRLLQGVRVRSDVVVEPSHVDAGPGAEPARPAGATDEQAEHELLQSVVDFRDTLVREVMTPRPDIAAVPAEATLDQLRAVFAEEQYSRLPVYEGSLDTVLGFVYVKDLVTLVDVDGSTPVVQRLLRPAYVVPETKRVAELLKALQREHVQSAIVHDEYGGTAGLVTIEDLLEEIVGEIRDEYDVEAEPIVDEGAGSFVFNGRVSVDDLSKRLDVPIDAQGFETVGGYLLARLGRVPQVGESFEVDELSVDVLEAERRRVHRVRLRRRSGQEADASA